MYQNTRPNSSRTVLHGQSPIQLEVGFCHLPSTDVSEELVVFYLPTRSLRFEFKALLIVPQTLGVSYDNRCIGKAASTLWNNLPVKIGKRFAVILRLHKTLYKLCTFICFINAVT